MPHRSAPLSFGSLAVHPPMAAPQQRIGLLGGTFDPPHAAHLAGSLTALKRLRLERVWWLVSPANPLKSRPGQSSLEQRLAEARALAQDARIEVSGFEATLPSTYTFATLQFLRRRAPHVHFVWLMGADCLAEFHRWREWRAIFATMPIAVIDRPGYRLRAMASPAARSFASAFVPEECAGLLARLDPPAWTFLTLPLSSLSSTRLRAQRSRSPQ